MDFDRNEVVRFGVFELDLAARRLSKRGRLVHLQDKPFETLALLLEEPGKLVTREELRQRLWPADTFVAFDDGVNTAIRKLREALGDAADSPRFVETVPRHGYRFIAQVERQPARRPDRTELASSQVAGAAASAPAVSMAAGSAERLVPNAHRGPAEPLPVFPSVMQHDARRRGRRGVLVLSGVALVASLSIGLIGGWVASLELPGRGTRRLTSAHLRRHTFETGYHASPSWTPDGNMLVFAASRDGNVDIWLQHAGGGVPLRLTDDAAADWQPSVSPDGLHIAFRSERDGGGLFVMPLLGGSVRQVADFGHSPSWSPDALRILFFADQLRTTETAPVLHVVELGGGPPRQVVAAPDGGTPSFCCFRGAAWHPDGRRVSVLSTDFGNRWNFVTYDSDTGAAVRSDTSAAEGSDTESDRELGEERLFGSVSWSPSGDALFFLAYSGGVRSIWRVPVDPEGLQWLGPPEQFTTGPASVRDFSVSRSGERLVFSTYEDSVRLWALPRNASTGRLAGPGTALDVNGHSAGAPDISPDGTRLAYVNAHAGLRELRIRDLKSGTERTLFAMDGFMRAHPRWSPDGRALSYSRRMRRPSGIWTDAALFRWLEARGEEERITSGGSPIGVAQSWARDSGNLLVVWFDTRVSPPRAAVAVLDQSAAPTAEHNVRVVVSDSDHDLYAQDLSPDGRWVAYNAIPRSHRTGSSSRLFIVPLFGGSPTPVSTGEGWEDKLQWATDGRFVYFVTDRSGVFNIWARAFDSVAGTLLDEAFPVTRYAGPARGMPSAATASSLNFAVSKDVIIAPVIERVGSIWSLELRDGGNGTPN